MHAPDHQVRGHAWVMHGSLAIASCSPWVLYSCPVLHPWLQAPSCIPSAFTDQVDMQIRQTAQAVLDCCLSSRYAGYLVFLFPHDPFILVPKAAIALCIHQDPDAAGPLLQAQASQGPACSHMVPQGGSAQQGSIAGGNGRCSTQAAAWLLSRQ